MAPAGQVSRDRSLAPARVTRCRRFTPTRAARARCPHLLAAAEAIQLGHEIAGFVPEHHTFPRRIESSALTPAAARWAAGERLAPACPATDLRLAEALARPNAIVARTARHDRARRGGRRQPGERRDGRDLWRRTDDQAVAGSGPGLSALNRSLSWAHRIGLEAFVPCRSRIPACFTCAFGASPRRRRRVKRRPAPLGGEQITCKLSSGRAVLRSA